ncbi:MAG TPA: Gfo/Idh/MocA family oxidoreductase [Aggregatilineales bacterium]|nr:Gfo/Idh/MocA family oxidoreductase [Aggregatilineales bacterium]
MKARNEIRFGIIGLGLMGREFASAAARWAHLLNLDFVPRIVAICDTNPGAFDWYESNFDSIRLKTTNYHDLLSSAEVDAIYCAVPHNLHQQLYIDIIRAGKHLLGEKPFGIDLQANQAILAAIAEHRDVVVACSSEFPFFPAAQKVMRYIQENRFGTILEAWSGLLHSSDLDPNKKINWKRMVEINGEYGCMGDLGLHALHLPLRAGWLPDSVHATLSKIVTQRPDSSGALVPCQTWDNATLCCDVRSGEQHFPLYVQTYRIAPGESNTWYIRILGTRFSVEYSTKYPKTLRTMEYAPGGEQAWKSIDVGYESVYPAITGSIFEFGFPDAILQMWAAFCDELTHGRSGMAQPFYCATPQETGAHHRILTAALESGKHNMVVVVQ